MNLQDISAHWVALHEALAVGRPFAAEADYTQALAFVEAVFSDVAANPAHPLDGLVGLLAERIREYEDRVHPWPDTTTPATALASLMQAHGLRQGDLPEVGSQGVVSEVLAGKRALNARQVSALAKRFGVAAELLLP